MIEVGFYETVDDSLLKFAVIIAKSQGQWVFCKHRERDTYELPEMWTYPRIQPKLLEEARRRGAV